METEETETEKKPLEEEESEEEIKEAPIEAEKAEEEKEEKPAPEKKKEKEEEIVEERIYTVPLGRAWGVPRGKHSPRAVRLLRSFIVRHMKAEEDMIRIVNEVNEKIWSKGIQKPPRKIRIRATKDTEGIVTVHLAEGD
jgi:large subunit ribosomal protein L31e